MAIAVLQATQTVKGAQEVLGTSWDETWRILKKAVARGKARKTAKPMPRIGIDEKAFRKGHNYITLIYDLDNSTVKAIADGLQSALPFSNHDGNNNKTHGFFKAKRTTLSRNTSVRRNVPSMSHTLAERASTRVVGYVAILGLLLTERVRPVIRFVGLTARRHSSSVHSAAAA